MMRRIRRSTRIVAIAAGIVLSAGLLAASSTAGAGDGDLPDVYEVRAEGGGVHHSIAIPAYFEFFAPYSMSEASNGQTHTLSAHWYGGFFLTAAAQFYGFPPFPGTTETLYPQGPEKTGIEFAPLPGGKFWEAQGESSETTSSGWATYQHTEDDSPVRIAHGTAWSEVDVTNDGALGRTKIEMQGIDVAGGLLRIGSVLADGEVSANGIAGSGMADGDLTMLDVELAGVALEVTPTEVRFADGDGADAPGDLESLFSETGISLRRLVDTRDIAADGSRSALGIGGVEVVVSRPADELEATFTIGRLRLSSRAERFESATTTTTRAPAPTTPPAPSGDDLLPPDPLPGPGVLGGGTAAPTPRSSPPGDAPEVAAPPLTTREIRRVTPASTGNFAGLAALLLLVTPGGLVVRRSLRGVHGS